MKPDMPMSKPTADKWADAYTQHRDAMYGAARRVLGDTADTVDAVSEAMRQMMTKGWPEDVHNMRAYLASAAGRKAIDIARKNSRAAPTAPDRMPEHDTVGHEDDTVERLDMDERLAALGERERYAFEQRVLRRQPAKDVAAELGVKPQRISQIINDVLAKFDDVAPFISGHSDDS